MIVVMVTGCSLHLIDMLYELKNNVFGYEVKIIGVNCDENALPYSLIDERYIAPRATDPKYIDYIIDVCNKEKVDVILPFVTCELLLLAKNKYYIESKTRAKVSVSSFDSMIYATDKIKTYELFHEFMPTELEIHSREDIDTFFDTHSKVCCKLPDRSGGLGFAIIDDEKALEPLLLNKYATNRYIRKDDLYAMYNAHAERRMILQEFIEGHEFSLCVLADNGKIVYDIGYDVNVISYGAPMVARIASNSSAYEIAKKVIEELRFDGNCNFDFMIKEDGTAVLLDINPRINANIGFVMKAGMNLVLYRIMMLMLGENSKESCMKIIDNSIEKNPVKKCLCMQKVLRNDYHEVTTE